MLQEFWSYFMTTGNIDAYMNYKAYEREYEGHSGSPVLPKETHEVG